MVYVEYTCDLRRTAPGTCIATSWPTIRRRRRCGPNASQVLLSNIQPNPGGTACFTYMPNPAAGRWLAITCVARRRDHADRATR